VVGLIPEELGGLHGSWGEDERFFIGHIDVIHIFFVP